MKVVAGLIALTAASLVAYAFKVQPMEAIGGQQKAKPSVEIKLAPTSFKSESIERERAIVAGGCFWGTEKYLRQTAGVTATAVGYIAGNTKNPTYEEVCTGRTGHTEAVMVEFDPTMISYSQILDRFWQIHNPCTLNRQGPDFGSQYRSGIYPLSESQYEKALESINKAAPLFRKPIVTEVVKDQTFFMAEDYHQQYAEKTGRACAIDRSDHVGG